MKPSLPTGERIIGVFLESTENKLFRGRQELAVVVVICPNICCLALLLRAVLWCRYLKAEVDCESTEKSSERHRIWRQAVVAAACSLGHVVVLVEEVLR